MASAAPAAIPQSGFWWLPEPIAGLIPVPGVPPGGLYIASAPTGAQAESAIRIPLAAGADRVTLTLQVSALTKLNNPSVVGYPSTGDWPTGGPQPWSARPAYRTTSTPAVGVFDAGDKKMTISFPASEATAGIVLVPGSTGQVAPTFTVSFAPPTAADISVSDTAPSTSPRPTTGIQTHRPTHSPVATNRPSASPSPSASASASASESASSSPHRTPSHRPRPTSTGAPRPISSIALAPTTRATAPDSTSGHGTRDVAIAIGIVLVAAGASLLVWRRQRE
ncbi:MAG TPA: hypothetical protein VHW74_17245 [Mycobacteriales bacterium]|nr:hypothetical protein [Mycobacteriales bacterium]